MSYRKRKDRNGEWYVFIELSTFGRSGRVVRRSPVQTERGAKRYEHELREQMLTGEFWLDDDPAPALADFAQEWMDLEVRPNKSENTAICYKSYLNNHILPYFGPATPIDQIDAKAISKWRAKKSSQLRPNTVRGIAICLSSLLSTAVDWGELDEAPSVGDFSQGQQDPPQWMTQDECRKLVSLIESRQARAMVQICWQTGVRKMTMAGLKWDDIDWECRTVHVQRKLSRDGQRELPLKSQADRVIPLTQRALGAFEAVTENREVSPYVFYDHAHDRAWDANQLRDLINDVWPRDEVEKGPGWHILRHSFASQLAKDGVSLKKISKLMGHKSVTVTERYAHLQTSDLHADLGALMG